ncbi:di-trans,poly-cis-decaprenylcistransferase [Nocardia beijingensis]|uniref:polyprenyl diphosphate synthase n=1 Tax=Nocardia beijingensis TaxID=95162 RepID=UPI001893042F|nr:polyprenyl diphosphate synthase [Nocardia beijingensis]MBF6465219.1 di-trans,poly-cis-decaprenylcistransferase [Nocardia beijingensis]
MLRAESRDTVMSRARNERSQPSGVAPTERAGPIPTAPGAWPFIGHTIALLRDPWSFLSSLSALDSGLVRIRLGPMSMVAVCDPGLTHQILSSDRVFDKGGPIYDAIRKMLGDNIFTVPHDIHRRQRRLVQPAFHPHRMLGYAAAMTTEVDAVIGRWTDGTNIDVMQEMLRITTRSFLAAMFSDSLTSAMLDQALDDFMTIARGLYRQMLWQAAPGWLPLPGSRRYRNAQLRLRRTVTHIIAQRRSSGAHYDDLLSSLLTARDDETVSGPGTRFDDEEIYNQIVVFFIAGSETTAGALAWSLLLLSTHPAVLAQTQDEVDRVVTDGTARYEQLSQLIVTTRVLTEAMRLYPPGWMFTRIVTVDTELDGHLLRRGTSLLYSPYLLHHLDSQFAEPQRFDPNRWVDRSPKDRGSAYLPFGAGPRVCPGQGFAMTEATLALATIVRRWQPHPRVGQQVRSALAVAMRPAEFRMRVTPRASATTAISGRTPAHRDQGASATVENRPQTQRSARRGETILPYHSPRITDEFARRPETTVGYADDGSSLPVPQHVAVILDGNRRWAEMHSASVEEAYRLGAVRVRELMVACDNARIPFVTVWALSQDNLRRGAASVRAIVDAVTTELVGMAEMRRWRIRLLGSVADLPADAAQILREVAQRTADCPGAVLNVAVSYSGRKDIAAAAGALLSGAANRLTGLDLAEVEHQLVQGLSTAGQPDIDLLIRTSGEQRLSDFMLWQAAHAELYFTETLWPDFQADHFELALRWYGQRQRRYGE